MGSCSKKTFTEKSTYFPGNEPLKRSEYKITDNFSESAEVTSYFGLFYSNDRKSSFNVGSNKKFGSGLVNIQLGSFNLNLLGSLSLAAFSSLTAYAITELGGTDRRGDNNIPLGYSAVPGLVFGLAVNNMLFGAAHAESRAVSLANYELIEKNEVDFLLNPRYKIVKSGGFFTRTSNVTITSKGMTIIPDLILLK